MISAGPLGCVLCPLTVVLGGILEHWFAVRNRRGATGITRSTRIYLKNMSENPLDVRSHACVNAAKLELGTFYTTHSSTLQMNMIKMIQPKFIAGIAVMCVCLAASSLSGQTIPAGTAISVRTTSQISERDPVGRTFTGRVDQNVVVNRATVLPAGTNVTGRIQASRASSRPGRGSGPLSVALTSISRNGRNIAIKTNSVQPQGAMTAQTAQMRSRGVSAGNILVTPGTTMQFVLSQAVTL